jgi:methylmalonyl-CoA mutase N-terminal domain/subunit
MEMMMAETPSDIHNRLAREFVMMAGTQTETYSELLVVMESAILATMHLLVTMHGIKPAQASIYVEAGLQAATQRFSEGTR